MRVAGFGFREAASVESLRDALAAAGGSDGVVALATVAPKATAVPLQVLATELALPVCSVSPETLAMITTITQSPRLAERFGAGSVAEAAALAVAGPGARLLGPRSVSRDGMAAAALAERAVI